MGNSIKWTGLETLSCPAAGERKEQRERRGAVNVLRPALQIVAGRVLLAPLRLLALLGGSKISELLQHGRSPACAAPRGGQDLSGGEEHGYGRTGWCQGRARAGAAHVLRVCVRISHATHATAADRCSQHPVPAGPPSRAGSAAGTQGIAPGIARCCPRRLALRLQPRQAVRQRVEARRRCPKTRP